MSKETYKNKSKEELQEILDSAMEKVKLVHIERSKFNKQHSIKSLSKIFRLYFDFK